MSHVSEKIIERFSPSRAYDYPSASVMLKRRILRVIAALKHIPICPVFWRSPMLVCEPLLFLKTSATFGGVNSGIQRFSEYLFFHPTITTTKPQAATVLIWNSFENNKSSESFPCQCKYFSHNGSIIRETTRLIHKEVESR